MKEKEKKLVLAYRADYEVLARRVSLRENFSDVLHAALVKAGWIRERKAKKELAEAKA